MIADQKVIGARNVCLVVCIAGLLVFATLRYEQLRRDLIGSDIIVLDKYNPWTWALLTFTVVSLAAAWRAKLPLISLRLLIAGNALHLAWLVVQLWWALSFHWPF